MRQDILKISRLGLAQNPSTQRSFPQVWALGGAVHVFQWLQTLPNMEHTEYGRCLCQSSQVD
jgi:hypothetical protein